MAIFYSCTAHSAGCTRTTVAGHSHLADKLCNIASALPASLALTSLLPTVRGDDRCSNPVLRCREDGGLPCRSDGLHPSRRLGCRRRDFSHDNTTASFTNQPNLPPLPPLPPPEPKPAPRPTKRRNPRFLPPSRLRRPPLDARPYHSISNQPPTGV